MALERFTAEFGMGSGVGTPHLSHQTGRVQKNLDAGCHELTSAIRTRRHLEPSLGTGKMSFIEVEAIKPIERLVRLS